MVGLIGPNGAGKTTLVDAVTGFTEAEGEVTLDGRSLTGLAPHRRKAAGLARTWQSGELFGNLTVTENLLVSARTVGFALAGARPLRAAPGPREASTTPSTPSDCDGIKDRPRRDLTLGQQKLVGVARALAGTCGCSCSTSLQRASTATRASSSASGSARSRPRRPGVLLIDHDMSLVLNVCDVVYVLEFGKVIFRGTPAEARVDAAVAAAYLGAPLEVADV